MSAEEDPTDEGVCLDELSFIDQLPANVELECPVCLQVMWKDPHLVTCCGHHFCSSCILQIHGAHQPCPLCKERDYQTFIDKHSLRIINNISVYCPNKQKGCNDVLKIRELSSHRKPNQRYGDCPYEVVNCFNEGCQVKQERYKLRTHETDDCEYRPFYCDYCECTNTVTKEHYNICDNYPITCPSCSKKVPRGYLDFHLQFLCSQTVVKCEYNWVGCSSLLKRQDISQHMTERQVNHTALLSQHCQQLKQENDKLSRANDRLKGLLHYAVEINDVPMVPIAIKRTDTNSGHFYSDHCGYKMSIEINEDIRTVMQVIIHKGRFDRALPWPFKHSIVLRQGLVQIYLLHYERQSYDGILCEVPLMGGDNERAKFVVDLDCTRTTNFNPYNDFDIVSVIESVGGQ